MKNRKQITKVISKLGILCCLVGMVNPVLASSKVKNQVNQTQSKPSSPPFPLPLKEIGCEELKFQSTLNSNWILAESKIDKKDRYFISIDKTLLDGHEFYLNYKYKSCSQADNQSQETCRFTFRIYRLLPQASSSVGLEFSDVYEEAILDFGQNQIWWTKLENGQFTYTNTTLPSNCSNLANEYITRENSLVERQHKINAEIEKGKKLITDF